MLGVLALERSCGCVRLLLSPANPAMHFNQLDLAGSGKSARLLLRQRFPDATDALGMDAIVLHLDGGERVLWGGA